MRLDAVIGEERGDHVNEIIPTNLAPSSTCESTEAEEREGRTRVVPFPQWDDVRSLHLECEERLEVDT